MSDHEKEAQEERAKRLREHIEELKQGTPASGAHPSIREQIEQREREAAK